MRAWARFVLGAAVFSFLLNGCSVLPEATFQLATDSRLPRWFEQPAGLSRSQVAVQMDYYVAPWGRRATFTFLGPDRRVIQRVTARVTGDGPRTSEGKVTRAYPSYEIVRVGGVVDIVEHRQLEPQFWMTDDPAVWKSLAQTK
jgi:hypothetical protein